jgi:hypothetical protein
MNNWGEVYKYKNGFPSVIWWAHVGNNLLGELMKGGGPMDGFLYEVGEMKRDLQMGRWIVDEMEGSCYCEGATQP